MVTDRIEEIAHKELKDRKKYSIPVDPIILARELDIDVKNATFKKENISGAISKKNGKTVIYVNSSDCYERKRFTVAHELGHYFLHLKDNDGEEVDMNRKVEVKKTSKELEADEFAAALLMDEKLIREQFNKLKALSFLSDSNIISALAELFIVSITAMTIRLSNLGLIE